jgi:HK97 family phage major capsid protein
MTPEERSELESLVTRDEALTPDEQARFRDLEAIYAEHERAEQVDAERRALAARLNLDKPLIVESSNRSYDDDQAEAGTSRSSAWDLDVVARFDIGADELMSRAMSAVEDTPGPTDARREALSTILERDGDENMARIVLATTSPAYKRAFSKSLRHGGSEWAELDAEERAALRFANGLARAMSVATDNAGGYLVPTDIEPAVTLSADGTTNPIYNLARKVMTTSDTYRVVTSPNAAWSWDGENTEVSDDTPTFANVDITLYVAQGFIPVSFRSQQATNAMSIAQTVLNGGYNDLVGTALAVGTGSQPQGIVTALVAGSRVTASAGADAFAVGDVYALHEAVAPRHRRNATWLANNSIINDIRQFATADNHTLIARLGEGQPGSLLGQPLVECSDIDGTYGSGDNYVLVLMDFQHYVVAEAIGTMVRIIPDVVGANGRPIGASGVYMQTSFGADSVLDTAGRVLNVT